jgi:hypothetical protein
MHANPPVRPHRRAHASASSRQARPGRSPMYCDARLSRRAQAAVAIAPLPPHSFRPFKRLASSS